jgi:hypothetical protein
MRADGTAWPGRYVTRTRTQLLVRLLSREPVNATRNPHPAQLSSPAHRSLFERSRRAATAGVCTCGDALARAPARAADTQRPHHPQGCCCCWAWAAASADRPVLRSTRRAPAPTPHTTPSRRRNRRPSALLLGPGGAPGWRPPWWGATATPGGPPGGPQQGVLVGV